MKKSYCHKLKEIQTSDITRISDYIEEAVQMYSSNLLGITNGVLTGLNVIKINSTSGYVSTGAIIMNGIIGELESSSGFVVIPPTGALVRTDTIAAYYQEVLDSPATGYVLNNIINRIKQVQTLNTRKFGAAKIQVFSNTAPSGLTSGYVSLGTMYLTSGGIQSIDLTLSTIAYPSGNIACDNLSTQNIQSTNLLLNNLVIPVRNITDGSFSFDFPDPATATRTGIATYFV